MYLLLAHRSKNTFLFVLGTQKYNLNFNGLKLDFRGEKRVAFHPQVDIQPSE